MVKLLLVDKEKVNILKIKTLAYLFLLHTFAIIPIFLSLVSVLEGQLTQFDFNLFLNIDSIIYSLIEELRYYFNLLLLFLVLVPTIFGLISIIYLNFVYSEDSFKVKHIKNVLSLIDLGVTLTTLIGTLNFIQLYNSGFVAQRSLDQVIFSVAIIITYLTRKKWLNTFL